MTNMSVIELIDTMVKENPEKLAGLIRSNNKYFHWYWMWLEEKVMNAMDDLIRRGAAIDELTENKEMINAALDSLTLDYNTRRNQEQRREQIDEDIETIKALPSAGPERCPLALEVRSIGRWIDDNCSVCGFYVHHGDARNYCPNCGTKML